MASAPPSVTDRVGVGLSGLCAAHCVASLALAGSLGAALTNPLFHEIGLALALLLGAVAFASGLARHARRGPLLVGGAGLVLMAAALLRPHGTGEALLTVAGVVLLAGAHLWNGRLVAGHATAP